MKIFKVAGGIGAGIVLALIVARLLSTPLREKIEWSRNITDENGELLRLTLSADDKYRMYLPLKSYPRDFINSILIKEDRHFYSHAGVNPVAVVRAALQTYGQGGRRIGGSTITMQLSRLMSQVPSRDLLGKLRQIWGAAELELFHSKDEILEAYLNLLPYGANVEGAATASLIYFRKPLMKLNPAEMLILAVIPQSPKLRALGPRGEIFKSVELFAARDRLFEEMLAEKILDEGDRALLNLPFETKGTRDLPFLAPHFVNDLMHSHPQTPNLRSTLNLRQQRLVERIVKNYVERQKIHGIKNASALLIDWSTMEVKSVVGSVDFFNSDIAGQVDGTRAYRSPGSTLKPFAYALAFDQGVVHPLSLVKDAPLSFGGFNPENFDRDFQGPISVEDALIRSRNLPAVQVTSRLKSPDFYEFLQNVGIQNLQSKEFYGLSTVLGGLEVTGEDLIRMYAMFPHQGELKSLVKIKGEESKSIGKFLTAESSLMILDILKKIPRPAASGGSKWSKDQREIYWKTGTSQAFRDAWTLGISGRFALSVWVGNFDGSSNPALIGRDMAAPLFFEIMDALSSIDRKADPLNFKADLNLKKVEVCALSGDLPGAFCPHKKLAWFIPGVSPIHTCDLHREVRIDARTGLRLCPGIGDEERRPRSGDVRAVFEFWPSDLLKLFRQAGMPRALPPAWDPRCAIKDLAMSGRPPAITSPKLEIVYSLRSSQGPKTPVIFSAIADADVRESFWFVNDAFVGKTKAKETLVFRAGPGRHSVRVVDDQGRSDERFMQVEVVN